MSKMLKLVNLIRYLESGAPAEAKILEINYARSNGLISDDEAVELAILLDMNKGGERNG